LWAEWALGAGQDVGVFDADGQELQLGYFTALSAGVSGIVKGYASGKHILHGGSDDGISDTVARGGEVDFINCVVGRIIGCTSYTNGSVCSNVSNGIPQPAEIPALFHPRINGLAIRLKRGRRACFRSG
jgi:hypothetical protein